MNDIFAVCPCAGLIVTRSRLCFTFRPSVEVVLDLVRTIVSSGEDSRSLLFRTTLNVCDLGIQCDVRDRDGGKRAFRRT